MGTHVQKLRDGNRTGWFRVPCPGRDTGRALTRVQATRRVGSSFEPASGVQGLGATRDSDTTEMVVDSMLCPQHPWGLELGSQRSDDLHGEVKSIARPGKFAGCEAPGAGASSSSLAPWFLLRAHHHVAECGLIMGITDLGWTGLEHNTNSRYLARACCIPGTKLTASQALSHFILTRAL